MTLKGEAKTAYQREYMRRRRAGLKPGPAPSAPRAEPLTDTERGRLSLLEAENSMCGSQGSFGPVVGTFPTTSSAILAVRFPRARKPVGPRSPRIPPRPRNPPRGVEISRRRLERRACRAGSGCFSECRWLFCRFSNFADLRFLIRCWPSAPCAVPRQCGPLSSPPAPRALCARSSDFHGLAAAPRAILDLRCPTTARLRRALCAGSLRRQIAAFMTPVAGEHVLRGVVRQESTGPKPRWIRARGRRSRRDSVLRFGSNSALRSVRVDHHP